jgi:hypothetical protein
MEQMGIDRGRGSGARFMKKNPPVMPFGYRFITMARFCRCGNSHGETSRYYWSRSRLVRPSPGQKTFCRLVR